MAPIANIKGPQGDPGSTWYTGVGVPSNGLGLDGDLYLNTANSYFYLKVAGAWVFQGQLTSTSIGNMDGGNPASIFGGTTPVDGGGP